MKTHYRTILLGATFYAYGYAATAEDCLVVERLSTAGADFADCLNAAPLSAPTTELGKAFADDVTARGLVTECGIGIVPFAFVLEHTLFVRKLKVLLETEILSADAHSVTVFNRDGMQTFTADRVVDTRGFVTAKCTRTLALSLMNGTKMPPISPRVGFLQQERQPNEWLFHLRLHANEGESEGHRRIRRMIEKRAFGDWQAAIVATSIAYHYPKPVRQIKDGVYRIPSAAFGNPIAAIEGGVNDAVHG